LTVEFFANGIEGRKPDGFSFACFFAFNCDDMVGQFYRFWAWPVLVLGN
jgi:hypothetical protein